MVMIPIAERYKYRCHFCGTNKSVKYLVDYYVSWMNGKAITVPCCNICVLLYRNNLHPKKESE